MITDEFIKSFLNCPYKLFLKFQSKTAQNHYVQGVSSAFIQRNKYQQIQGTFINFFILKQFIYQRFSCQFTPVHRSLAKEEYSIFPPVRLSFSKGGSLSPSLSAHFGYADLSYASILTLSAFVSP
jgi:hypothetical protein